MKAWHVICMASVASVAVLPGALAATIVGTAKSETLRGTPTSDRMSARGGNDKLFGLAGGDVLDGGSGRDYVSGGAGADRILIRDNGRDTAVCGPGRDTVQADAIDAVRLDCEVVSKPKPPAPPPAPPPPPPPRPVVVPTAASPCMLAQNVEAAQNEAAFGFPLFHEGPLNVAGAMPTGGLVRAVVIAVDFPDAVATQDAAQLASTTTSGLGRFEEYSYGSFSVTSQIVPGWRRMSRPASSYASLSDGGDGARTFLEEATGVVDAEVDFSSVHFVFVLAPGLAPHQRAGNPAWSVFPGRGFTRDGNEIRHGATMMRAFTLERQDIASVAVHEVAHSLGLPEAYQQTQSGTRFDLVGMWDPMSEPNPRHFLAWHKYRVGWIAQDEIACLDAPRQERVTLRPQETRGGGIQAVVMRTGPSNAYVVEARLRLGLDGSLCNEGVLVYTVDSQVRNGGGPIYVHRSAPDDPGRQVPCGTLHNAPFQPGQTFEDGQVKVTAVSRTGSTYVVDVTRKG